MKVKSTLRRLFILAGSSLLAVSHAHAQDQNGTWLDDSAGDWTDSTKWTDGLIANGADFTATFGNVITADRSITLNGNRTIGNITAADINQNYTLTGNTLTLDRTSGVPTIDVLSSRELTIDSIIAGDDGLQKSGGGTLSLKGTNTYSGGLTIKAGTVRNFNTGTGGNFLGTGSVTIGDDANTGAAAALTFRGGNFTSTNPISVVGTGNANINISGWNQTLNGAITLSRNLNVVSSNPGGSNLTFGGGVIGTGNIVLQSNANTAANSSKILFQTGSIDMTGSITNSGTGNTTTVGNIDTTISAVIGTNVTGVTQNSANSRLILSGLNTFIGNISIAAGSLHANLSNTTNNPSAGALGNAQATGRTMTIASGATLNFTAANVMGGGASTPKLKLIANGGTIRNTGNIFNMLGPVELNGGTLSSFGGGGLFPSFTLNGEVTVGGSAVSTISTSGTNGQIGLLTAGTTFNVADAVSGSDLNVTGVLANFGNPLNVGTLIKTGAGSMTLSGINTYTGATTVNAGALILSSPGSTAAASAVTVNGGDLGGTGTVGGNVTVAEAGNLAPGIAAGTLNITGNLDISAMASGAGKLKFDLDALAGTNDSIVIGGTLALGTLALDDLAVTNLGGLQAGTYTLMTSTGFTGTVDGSTALIATGFNGKLQMNGNHLELVVTSIVTGSAYHTWATTNAPASDPKDDFDGDGVPNAVEFVLGGLATTNDLSKLPVFRITDGNRIFSFFRDQDSIDPKTALSIEVSTDLVNWDSAPSPYAVPDADTGGVINPGVTVDADNPATGTDRITLTVSQSPDTQKFARLRVVITP
jgi:fibronectin-binding autotransporter adhesin